MNSRLLRAKMTMHGDTQIRLARALGLSISRFNAKLNERGGASFTQKEIEGIILRYQLSPQDSIDIFFPGSYVKRNCE